jgi:hypothetical protein
MVGIAAYDDGNGCVGWLWGAQVNRGYTALPYLVTTTTARIGIPQAYDAYEDCFGVLVEPAATNLVTASQRFTDSFWDDAALFTDNTAVAPDGSTTAATHNGNGTNGLTTTSAITVTNGANYTQSVYIKYLSQQWIMLQYREHGAGTDRVRAWFDVLNGVAGTSAVVDSGLYVSHSITAVGNGWYRITVTGSIANTTGAFGWNPVTADGGATIDSGDTYLWGAQLELGTIATSYIPTLGSTATRAADQVTTSTSNIPFDATQWSLFAEAKSLLLDTTNGNAVLALDDGTADERAQLSTSTTTTGEMFVADGGVTQVNASANGTIYNDTLFREAARFKLNDFAISADGTTVVTDTGGTMPTVTTVNIGCRTSTPTRHINGYIYKAVVLPRIYTDAELV